MGSCKFIAKEVKGQQLLIRSFSGTITVPEVIDSFENILNEFFTTDHKFVGLITDLSNAKLDFKLAEFRSMVGYIKNNKTLTSVPYAVIVNSPVNSLFPSLASKYIGMPIKPFKTLADSFIWFENLNASKAS